VPIAKKQALLVLPSSAIGKRGKQSKQRSYLLTFLPFPFYEGLLLCLRHGKRLWQEGKGKGNEKQGNSLANLRSSLIQKRKILSRQSITNRKILCKCWEKNTSYPNLETIQTNELLIWLLTGTLLTTVKSPSLTLKLFLIELKDKPVTKVKEPYFS